MSGAWWEDAVVYQVYPRSFADADGDGVGDLPGLRSRLGYLADLGVDAVWLTPFYPSGSGWTAAWPGCAWTWPTASSRIRTCPTSPARAR